MARPLLYVFWDLVALDAVGKVEAKSLPVQDIDSL